MAFISVGCVVGIDSKPSGATIVRVDDGRSPVSALILRPSSHGLPKRGDCIVYRMDVEERRILDFCTALS